MWLWLICQSHLGDFLFSEYITHPLATESLYILPPPHSPQSVSIDGSGRFQATCRCHCEGPGVPVSQCSVRSAVFISPTATAFCLYPPHYTGEHTKASRLQQHHWGFSWRISAVCSCAKNLDCFLPKPFGEMALAEQNLQPRWIVYVADEKEAARENASIMIPSVLA